MKGFKRRLRPAEEALFLAPLLVGLGAVMIWRRNTRSIRIDFPHSGDSIGLSFSPDGRKLVVKCVGFQPTIYDVNSAAQLCQMAAVGPIPQSDDSDEPPPSWSPDSIRLAIWARGNWGFLIHGIGCER